jgi:four helix bundle protein
MRRRTRAFALAVIRLVRGLARSPEAGVMGKQVLRSATSTAANYRAACRARSRAAFIAKLDIVIEELDESEFWLDLLAESGVAASERIAPLVTEAHELLRILGTARQTAQRNRG